MNSIRIDEGATLISIGVFCASVLLGFTLQAGNFLPAHGNEVAATQLPTVTIVGKRLSVAERATMLQEDRDAAANSAMVERTGGKNNAG
jgi:hypothetical protein